MTGTITIRRSTEEDTDALARLAALDSRPAPRGEALIAVVDGELWAALDSVDGELIADPFRYTADVGDLLRVRARQEASRAAEETGGGGPRTRAGAWLPRGAGAEAAA